MSGRSGCQGASPGRRTPRQSRAQQTCDALINAAAELIDEVGYDRLTTKAIAIRAGTSIGAFYQFFANKDDVVDALAHRYRAQVHDYLDTEIGDPGREGVTDAWVARILGGLAQLFRNMPGFRGVWSGRLQSGPLGAQARTLRQTVFDVLDRRLGAAFPAVGVRVRRRALSFALETAYLVLSQVEDRKLAFAELQRMLGPYLASYFSAAAERTGPMDVFMPAERSGKSRR